MSVVFSGNWSGNFVSTGAPVFLPLPAGWDSIRVINESVDVAGGAGTSAEFYFRQGMTNGTGIAYVKEATIGALIPTPIAANLGFFVINNTVNTLGASVATTGISNTNPPNPPLVSTGATAGLVALSTIVRLYNPLGALQLGGMDFTVNTITLNTSFTLAYMPAILNAAPAAGAYRIVPYVPYFYPSTRYITKISQAAQAIVTLSVNHTYVVGQKVRLSIPTVTALAFGMTALDGVEATIVAVNQADVDGITNTITIDQNTVGMTAFALPLTADPSFTPAMVIPVGDNMRQSLISGTNYLADAVVNQGQTGVLLWPGTTGPAGVNTNVISWMAFKSFNT
jgi:hypothetical protein